MPDWKSVAELLRDQFHEWEGCGRGSDWWPGPVHLEPMFIPFPGHFVPYAPVPDDGRRPALLSRLSALFTEPAPLVPSEPDAPAEPLRPHYLGDLPALCSHTLHVPVKRVVKPDAAAGFLMGMRAARYPVAFDITGTRTGIALALHMRAPDEAIVLSSLRAHFTDVAAVPGDPLMAWIKETQNAAFAAVEFGLAREFMLPLATARSYDPDPLLALLAVLHDITEDEIAHVQILFEPARAPWAESVLRAVTTEDGSDFFENAPFFARLAREKFSQPIFAAALRLAVGGASEARLRDRLRRLMTALEEFEHPEGNAFALLDDADAYADIEDIFERTSHHSGMLLSLAELATLVHLPSASVELPQLLRSAPGTKAVPPALTGHALILGTNSHAGREVIVSLPPELRMRHMHVVGASGTGKSTFLLDILTQTARSGAGLALLDPHGDLVEELLLRIPEERIEDVIVLDPSDVDHPVGFNLLAAHSDLEGTLLASDLVAVFRRLSTSWGDQMHSVLANAIQAFLTSSVGGSLAELRRFLVEPGYRAEFLTTVEDEETVYYWQKEFPLLMGKPQGPILTRLDTFLRPKPLRHIFTQRENRLDFREILDNGRIFLAKLAQGAIGEENAALLGSLLVAKFHQAAMSRQELARDKRRNFHLVIDEFHEMVTPSLAPILSGTRKFGLGLTAAHQDLRTLYEADPAVANALLANAATRVVFRVSDEDATRLAEGFSAFPAPALRALGIGEAVCRVERADWDFNIRTRMIEAPDTGASERRERIIARSRAKYAGTVERQKVPRETPATRGPEPAASGLDDLMRQLERKPHTEEDAT